MVLVIFISNFKTYTRTRSSWVADEKQKKKGFRCVQGAKAFLNSLKGAIWKKILGNPAIDLNFIKNVCNRDC